MKKVIAITVFFGSICLAMGLASCNVTRKITTESSFFVRGDTTTQIITKTTESYDARKNIVNQ